MASDFITEGSDPQIQIHIFFFVFRHKFVLAYLPVIAFYHWGKVIYKFNLEDTYEEMVDQLVNMTGC